MLWEQSAYPSRWPSGPGGQQDQGHGSGRVVLQDQGEGNQPTISEVGLTQGDHGIIMLSQAHNMCKSGLDPIDCKSSCIHYLYFVNIYFQL